MLLLLILTKLSEFQQVSPIDKMIYIATIKEFN